MGSNICTRQVAATMKAAGLSSVAFDHAVWQANTDQSGWFIVTLAVPIVGNEDPHPVQFLKTSQGGAKVSGVDLTAGDHHFHRGTARGEVGNSFSRLAEQ
jgi:hypothetical protein